MSSWLVEHVPAGVLLIALIVLFAGGALLAQRFVRRRYPHLAGEEHNDVTRFAYGVIGFVYAFFIGFLVSAMWGHINTADVNARAEGAAVVQLARDAAVFDTADAELPFFTASARNAPICTVTMAGESPTGFTCAASFPWNIGRVKVASAPLPLTAVTSVMSGLFRRAEASGAQSRAW